MNNNTNFKNTFKSSCENEVLDFLSDLVACETTQGEPLENAPFGAENAKCLNLYLEKAKSFGFETKNVDGFAGHVEWKCGKENAPLFGVLGHLDVVPAGEGWDTPAFQLTRKDGKIFGRGVQDDKGCMAISLFALKILKDSGFVPQKDIRLIVGCNEENGSSCVEHYFTKERMPDVGISPDSDFPAIHSEKGIAWITCELGLHLDGFSSFSGGEKMNMVPSFIGGEYYGEIEDFEFEDMGLEVSTMLGKRQISARGVNAHGSMPEMGENAISKFLLALFALYGETALPHQKAKLEFLRKIAQDCNGKEAGIYACDDVSGELTMNLGVLSYQNGKLSFGLDIRYPNCTSEAEILCKLADISPSGTSFKVANSQAKLFVSPQDPLVKLCVQVYNDMTGENAQSKKIGGGTYARELKYGIAVGPVFDGVPTTIHNKNEHMTDWEFFTTGEILLEIISKIASEEFEI